MKKYSKLIGIIAIAAIIGIAFWACDDGGGGSGGGSGALGEELIFTNEQVYTEHYDKNLNLSYKKFTENLTLNDNGADGTGGVTAGKFTYTAGTPSELDVISNLAYNLEDDYDDITFSNNYVNYHILFLKPNGYGHYELAKENYKVSSSKSGGSDTYEYVTYIYVDGDVTITGKGITETETVTESGITWKTTFKSNDFSIALEEGWNAVHNKSTTKVSWKGSSSTWKDEVTIKLGNPNLKWVLDTDSNNSIGYANVMFSGNAADDEPKFDLRSRLMERKSSFRAAR